MHASFWHIFFNCWAIYMFGSVVEEMLGARNFLLLTLSSGVVGGLCQLLAALLWPGWFGGAVVGASAGAFGLVAAFATLFPERELFLLLFFIIPVKLRAKTLLLISATLACGGLLFPGWLDFVLGGNVANAAHLGGMLMGWFYVRKIIQGGWSAGFPLRPASRPPVIPPAAAPAFWRSKPAAPVSPAGDLSPDDLLRTQVDPILDKISAHGLNSLTPREREILEKASGRMAKR
jgi:membrane associated rhomboid family serine protease